MLCFTIWQIMSLKVVGMVKQAERALAKLHGLIESVLQAQDQDDGGGD